MLEGMPPATAEHDVLDAPQAGERAVRGSALRSGGYVVGILLSLISAPLLVRHLGFGDFGVYVTISAVVAIVAGVTDVGITSVAVREWAAREAGERRALLSNLFGARLSLTALGCLGALGFGVLAGYDAMRMAAVGVACGGLLMLVCAEALGVPLQAELRQGSVALAELLRQAVQVTLILVLIALGAGLVPLMATTIPAGLAAVVLIVTVSRQGIVRPSMHPRAWWALMHDTLPFAMASALGVVYLRTTVILTSLIAGGEQSGYFATAFRVMEVAIGVPVLLVGALFPVLARAAATDHTRLRAATARTFEGAFACGALTAVCVVAGAPLAIQILAGEQPLPAVEALAILGVGLGFSFIGASSQFALLALRQHRAILLVNAVALLVNVVLTLVLVPDHGARGAALALTVSEATVATLSTTLFARSLGGFSLPWGLMLRTACAAALGVAAALALKGVGIVPEAIVSALVCLGAGLALRVLPSEVTALPRRLFARSEPDRSGAA
jgi:O-antigen/teichoic acid export membrane protein